MKMLAPTVTSCASLIHGQSIEVVLYGQEQVGPTTVYEGDLFFGNRSFPATREMLIDKIHIIDL